MEKQLLEVQEGIKNYYEDTLDEERNYFIATLVDDIEIALKDILEDEVIESLRNDYDYSSLEDEEAQEDYIEKNKFDRFIVLSKDRVKLIYDNIVKYFENLGYGCYEGEFFPCDGNFKNLNYNETAFVK